MNAIYNVTFLTISLINKFIYVGNMLLCNLRKYKTMLRKHIIVLKYGFLSWKEYKIM